MLALCAGHAALAPMAVAQHATYPVPGPGDPRIKEFMYDPNAIVGIRGQLGYELTIEFGSDERIENVSIGDSLSWQVTPNRKATLLFLKPMSKANPTSMTVVTTERIYSFLLSATESKNADPSTLLRLRFLYPAPPAAADLSPPPPPPPPPPKPEDFNFDYELKGQKNIHPVRVFDDGAVTYFQFDSRNAAQVTLDGVQVRELIETGTMKNPPKARPPALPTSDQPAIKLPEKLRDPEPGLPPGLAGAPA